MTSLRRDAGPLGLTFASISAMVGSGWLFGALNAAKMAGPASLIAWVVGGIAVLLLAFVYAELSTLFPRPGAVIVFPLLCFGEMNARIMSWINFLAYICVAPVEAISVVSYADNFIPGLAAPATGLLTDKGIMAAIVLMAVFLMVNLLAVRLVLAINNAITWWKLLVPAVTVIALVAVHFRWANFTQFGFAPQGVGGVFAAISGSGIVFAYLGFRQAIELAGESAKPHRNLPFSIIGSVLLAMLLYLGLQAAFIGALSPTNLAHGWADLHFTGISGPFAGLAGILGLPWLAATLYADAAISPGGTGIIYNTTAARVVYATSEAGFLPSGLMRLSRHGVPVASLALSFIAGLLFLLPLPSWQLLVTYLTSIGVLAYGSGPVVLVCLRKTLPEADYPRPFRLAAAWVVAPLAFIVANLVVFWAGANVATHLFGGLLVAFGLYCGWVLATGGRLRGRNWRGAAWLGPYFAGLWLITWLGPQHGRAVLGTVTGSLIIALFSLVILALAQACALPDPQAAKARLEHAGLAGRPRAK